jgi:hypothetical protein
MKINLAIDCLEPSASDTMTTIHSFLSKNEWFNGTIYVIVSNSSLLSEGTSSSLFSLYRDIKIVDCSLDPNISSYVTQYSSNLDVLHRILKMKSLFLSEQKVIFASSGCLFFKNIFSLLSQKELSVSVNLANEIISEVFYRQKLIDFKKISPNQINSYLVNNSSLLTITSSQLKTSSSLILGESSTYFKDSVFLKRKSSLHNLHFIKYDSLRRDNRQSAKINQIWIQHKNQLFNLLKKPSFRSGRSSFSLAAPVNSKITRRVSNTKSSNFAEVISTNQIEKYDENKTSISVIIPAYRAAQYIEQCLDSIFSQTGKRKIEILVGVDACPSTLEKLKSIKGKYSNLKIYYSQHSVGAYVMRNSLFEKSSNDAILFFDADDVLMPNAISQLLKVNRHVSPVRFKYINFKNGEELSPLSSVNSDVAHGVFFIPRKLFESIGGFQNWKVGADTEFMKRCSSNKIREIKLDSPIFFRRVHENSLTQMAATGYNSRLRSDIKTKIKTMKDWRIPIHRHTTKLIEIA